MKISIICPLYNGENFIESLHSSILNQEGVYICSIKYILTDSSDNSEEILKRLGCNYKKILKSQFSHSKTREEAAFDSEGDILVFITQDIVVKDKKWLYNLTKPIVMGESEAAFSRQICNTNTIEKYIREKNYPKQSRIVTKESIKSLGFMTFFFSDASSAIKRDVFMELNGYDQKRLNTNEDMYIAYKIIQSGYKIKYCADSEIIHAHSFTLKELYKRYYETGIFLQENNYLLNYKSNKTGKKLLIYVLKRAFQEKNIKVTLSVIPNFGVRFLGSFIGKKIKKRKI